MAFRISPYTLFFLILLQVYAHQVTSVSISREDAVEGDVSEVTGQSSSRSKSDIFRLLRLMCGRTKESFTTLADNEEMGDVYEEFISTIEGAGEHEYTHEKALPTHQGSICQGMNTTCCKPSLEKISETLANKEFRFYYEKVLQLHSESCISPGKRLFISSNEVIREVMQELQVRINQSLDWTLPSDTFKNLTNYLISFSSVPNICPLRGLVEAQTKTLVRLTLENIFKNDIAVLGNSVLDCMANISMPLIEKYHNDIVNSIETQLYEMGVLIQSLKLAHYIFITIKSYSLSHSCISAITRMKYCAMCGGYDRFSPCLYMCLNTLQGCFADLAELHSGFIALVTNLRVLSQNLVAELRPEAFIDSHLSHFVSIVERLKEKEDYLIEVLETECQPYDSKRAEKNTREKRAKSIFQPIQDSKSKKIQDPILEQLNYKSYESVIEVELQCLERQGRLLKEVPDEICYLGDFKIAHSTNIKCWTGVTLGNYEHGRAGTLKSDQARNPVYSDLPMSTTAQYTDLIYILHDMSSKINATIALKQQCLQSDDEDCSRKHFQDCTRKPTISESGSGSGFVSGSGRTDGFVDYERVSTTREPMLHSPTTEQQFETFTNPPPKTDPFTLGATIISNSKEDITDFLDNFDNKVIPDEEKNTTEGTEDLVTTTEGTEDLATTAEGTEDLATTNDELQEVNSELTVDTTTSSQASVSSDIDKPIVSTTTKSYQTPDSNDIDEVFESTSDEVKHKELNTDQPHILESTEELSLNFNSTKFPHSPQTSVTPYISASTSLHILQFMLISTAFMAILNVI